MKQNEVRGTEFYQAKFLHKDHVTEEPEFNHNYQERQLIEDPHCYASGPQMKSAPGFFFETKL
jgi:hypothetical protein